MNIIPFYSIFGPDPFICGDYSISSIQPSDAEPIRKWRNEQISALRQSQKLTKAEQKHYINQIVLKDFTNKKPKQILVRFCFHEELIGYGGIVHINWRDLVAEVSFLLDTSRTKNPHEYASELGVFFELIKKVGFIKIGLSKLTTEAYAHRPYHVSAIENSGFKRDGILKGHARIDGKLVDAVLASCLRADYINSID